MPVPIRSLPFQQRLAAVPPPSFSQQYDSQSSAASSFAAASQFEPSQRDFSPPHPVTLPSNEALSMAAPLHPPKAVAPPRMVTDTEQTLSPVVHPSPVVSPLSAAAAAGLVVRPAATSLCTPHSVGTSPSSIRENRAPSSSEERLRAEPTVQPVAAPSLPSPPPFVSKHKHRHHPSQTVHDQRPVAYDTAIYSQQADVSASQHSSTSLSRPLVSASQQLPDYSEPCTTHTSAIHVPPAFQQTMHSPLPVTSLAQADGGYKLSHAVQLQQQAVTASQAGPYSDKQYTFPYAQLYPPLYSPYYSSMRPYAYVPPPASRSEKHRRRPASPVSQDTSSTDSSASDEGEAAGNNGSHAAACPPRSVNRRRSEHERDMQAAVEYQTVYRQHKQLLLNNPPTPHIAEALHEALSVRQLLWVSSPPASGIPLHSHSSHLCGTHTVLCLLHAA